MVWGMLFIGGLGVAIYLASSLFGSKKTPNYGAIVNAVTQKSMQRRNLFLDEFVPLMKSEFPDFADDFSVISLTKFCEFSGNWICAHHPESYAKKSREETIENETFRENLNRQIDDLFSPKFAKHAQKDFQVWLDHIDEIMKVAVQRSWPRLGKAKIEPIYK